MSTRFHDNTLKPSRSRPPVPGMSLTVFLVGLLVLLVCGAVFSPVLSAGFLSRDDGVHLRQAAQLSTLTRADLLAAFQTYSRPSESAGLYQPLTLLSLALDARLTTDPNAPAFQFHLTSLALHLINVGLVFLLIRRLSGSLAWGAVLSLLFGLHPIQTETVAWISQRGMLLGTFFALLALHAYMRHLAAVHRWWLIPATIGYCAAVFSMPIFIGLPVWMLMLDLWPARRQGWRPITEKLPMFVILLVAGVVHIAVSRHIPPRLTDDIGSMTLLAGSLAGFVERLSWPFQLAPYYPLAADGVSALRWVWWIAVPVLLIGTALWSFRRSMPLFVAVCGMLLLICPALQNVAYGSQLLGDSFLYAVLLAPLMAVAAWLRTRGSSWSRPRVRLSAIGLAAIVCVLAVHAYMQTFVWQSSRDLYEYTIARYPTWPRAYTGLVEAYLQENEFDSALYHAERAARIAPDDATTQFYLGTTLLLHHGSRSAEAIAPLEKALRSNPNWIACLQNLGIALARSGQTDRAISYLEKARDLEPESASIRIGLGHAYLRVERPASARRELQEALRYQNNPMIHLGLAMAWAANDAPDQARRHLAAALAKDPGLAGRIAAMPELRHLGVDLDAGGRTGDPFDHLTDPETIGAELPAARNARGT